MRSGSLCALLLETAVLGSPQRNSSALSTHSRSLECDSRQAVQTQSGDPDRVVPISAGVQSLVLQMGPFSCRPVCNPVQSQAPQVCITGAGSDSLGSRHPESAMGESRCLCIPSSLPAHQGDLQSDGLRLSQIDSALLLGPGQSFVSDSLVTQPFSDLLHRNLNNLNLHAWLLEPLSFRNKGSLTKWPQELRLLRLSTRAIYKSKWAIFRRVASRCLCIPSSLPSHQGDLQSDGSRLSQNDSDSSRLAQHALALGPGQSFGSDSLPAPSTGESGDTALQRSPSQEPQKI